MIVCATSYTHTSYLSLSFVFFPRPRHSALSIWMLFVSNAKPKQNKIQQRVYLPINVCRVRVRSIALFYCTGECGRWYCDGSVSTVCVMYRSGDKCCYYPYSISNDLNFNIPVRWTHDRTGDTHGINMFLICNLVYGTFFFLTKSVLHVLFCCYLYYNWFSIFTILISSAYRTVWIPALY